MVRLKKKKRQQHRWIFRNNQWFLGQSLANYRLCQISKSNRWREQLPLGCLRASGNISQSMFRVKNWGRNRADSASISTLTRAKTWMSSNGSLDDHHGNSLASGLLRICQLNSALKQTLGQSRRSPNFDVDLQRDWKRKTTTTDRECVRECSGLANIKTGQATIRPDEFYGHRCWHLKWKFTSTESVICK